MESIDKLILAISPETQQITTYHESGTTQPILGQPQKTLYRPINHQGQIHTLAQLKASTHARGLPVIEYAIANVYRKESKDQQRLFS